jgi:hypothetical protein
MSAWNNLLQFSRAHQGELTLSAYVAHAPADLNERRSWLVILRQQLAELRESLVTHSADEREAFEQSVARLFDALPTQGSMPRNTSWAYFCAAGGEELHFTLPPGVETSVYWSEGAHIVPFLRVAEPDDALVVQVDRQRARVSRLTADECVTTLDLGTEPIDEVGPFMGATARQGFHAGTRGRAGTDEAQRARREATERLHATLVRRIPALAEAGTPILIGGAPDAAQNVLEALPIPQRDYAVLVPELRMGPADSSLTELRDAVHALRAKRQLARVETLRDVAHANGRAAVGFEVAQRAADHHAIAELIFSEAAWHQHPAEIETLVQRALADGAHVEFAEPAVLTGANSDGVIAGLRFPLTPP